MEVKPCILNRSCSSRDTCRPWNKNAGSVHTSVRALRSFTGFVIPSQPPLGPLPPCPWSRTPFWLISVLSVPVPATLSEQRSHALLWPCLPDGPLTHIIALSTFLLLQTGAPGWTLDLGHHLPSQGLSMHPSVTTYALPTMLNPCWMAPLQQGHCPCWGHPQLQVYPILMSNPPPVAPIKSARRAVRQEWILKNKSHSFEGQSCVFYKKEKKTKQNNKTKHGSLVLAERSKHLIFFLHLRGLLQRIPVQNPVLQAKAFRDKKQKFCRWFWWDSYAYVAKFRKSANTALCIAELWIHARDIDKRT